MTDSTNDNDICKYTWIRCLFVMLNLVSEDVFGLYEVRHVAHALNEVPNMPSPPLLNADVARIDKTNSLYKQCLACGQTDRRYTHPFAPQSASLHHHQLFWHASRRSPPIGPHLQQRPSTVESQHLPTRNDTFA